MAAAYSPHTTPGSQTPGGADAMDDETSAFDQHAPVEYECGDCGSRCQLKPRDPIRCDHCGYRILYKPRTKRLIQYEAR